MPEIVTIRVPATSANCGPGFDCIGLACNLYNTLTLSLSKYNEIHLEATGYGEGMLKPSEHNFAVKAIRSVLNELGYYKTGLIIKMHNDIPMSRGLGSSSAAIVGGMIAANAILGGNFSKEKLFEMATNMEGHPDNVAPAIYGGITVSIMDGNKPYCMQIKPPNDLQMIAVVPEFPLATKQARAALPKEVIFADATFNVSRASLFVASMCQNDMALLKFALQDRLHQPYRSKFIPGIEKVFKAAQNAGAIECFISGSGSTLMAFANKVADGRKIGRAMCEQFSALDKKAVYHLLDFDNNGAEVISSS